MSFGGDEASIPPEADTVRCARCGKRITSPASLAAGMGKACRRRSLALEAIVELNRAQARRELRVIADRLAREGDPHAASVVSAAAEAVWS